MKFDDKTKRLILFLIAFIISFLIVITGNAQYNYNYDNGDKLRYNIGTSFLYNSFKTYNKKYDFVTHNYHQNMTFEADVYVPFSAFSSPLQTDRLSFYAKGGFIYDTELTIKNSLWDFNFEYKLFDKPLYLQANISAILTTGYNSTYNVPRIHGEEVSIGIHYNNQKHFKNRSSYITEVNNQLVNFYAQVDYLIHSKYMLIEPYVKELNQDNSNTIRNTIGVVLNLKNFLYFEQGIRVITKHNIPETFAMNPYYSDFNTKFTLVFKKINLSYEHICYHPFTTYNENPHIDGAANNVFLNFEF